MKEVLDFLNSIEGAGYGGMASFEIARSTVRDAVERCEVQSAIEQATNFDAQNLEYARDLLADLDDDYPDNETIVAQWFRKVRTETILAAGSAPPAQAPINRGRHYDIIAEALESYDEWMKDDDYNSTTALNKIMKRMRERLEMSDPPAPAQAPTVRPLEWQEGKGQLDGQLVWSAGDPWLFWIVKNPNEPQYIWCENFNIEGFFPCSPVRGSFENLDLAKAAAQADYTKRVLGALSVPSAECK